MESRKPSRQAVDARTADAKLKKAKTRRVRLRSLAARAVCGLLTVAALLTLPGQTQAQTTIWSSTLTVQTVDTGVSGCTDAFSRNQCIRHLSDSDFTYDRTTFTIQSIFTRPTNQLRMSVDEDIPTTANNLILNVNNRTFRFEDGDFGTPRSEYGMRGSAGPQETPVSLTITDPDGSPMAPETPAAPSLGATEASTTSLDVGWLKPALAGPFVNYYLRYRRERSNIWTDGPQDVTTTFARITRLGEDSTYEVQVLASNNNGDSDWSPSGIGETDSGIKPKPNAPTGLTATAHGEDRIDLSWTAPSDPGGSAVRAYKIEVRSDASNWLVLVRTGNTETEYSHRDVPAGVRRRYRVSALNTQGNGPHSNEADATTADAASGGGGTPPPDPQMQQSLTPLTASFVGVPPAHDGETPFWLELSFNAPVAQGSKPQLPALLDVTGGLETRFLRISEEVEHRFRTKRNTDFGGSGTSIPGSGTRIPEVEHRFRTKWNSRSRGIVNARR